MLHGDDRISVGRCVDSESKEIRLNSLTNVFIPAARKSSWLHLWSSAHQVRRFVRHLALLMRQNHSVSPENVDNGPNRAKARAGVPWASRMSMGKSGLCCFKVGYVDTTNCLEK